MSFYASEKVSMLEERLVELENAMHTQGTHALSDRICRLEAEMGAVRALLQDIFEAVEMERTLSRLKVVGIVQAGEPS